jgi:D-alanyl-lipoteichoic acid acyltransferase DltB (MBOAT superfamily)
MLFNSIEFALFLPLVFLVYWFVFPKNRRLQNAVLLLASYIFYGWWDWRFLLLIAFTSLVDYSIGYRLSLVEKPSKRKALLILSLVSNLGMLAFFKYFNFFIESFTEAFTFLGMPFDHTRLNIILPVGISFYTFQSLSYIFDIYKKQLDPEKNILTFFAFVSFFPQLVAGPIERARNLLPQFNHDRHFDYKAATDGMRLIAWGLFKKAVIADNISYYINEVYGDYAVYSGSTLLLAAIMFSVQIYCDFSGYSDMASGTSRLLGFRLMRNFAYPYFSRSIPEFWRRWHISLSGWFRDYLFYPLGASYGTKLRSIRNILIVFTVSGLWHGANLTYIVWGLIHGLLMIPALYFPQTQKQSLIIGGKNMLPGWKEGIRMIFTFFLVVLSWIFFRAETLDKAMAIQSGIFSSGLFSMPYVYTIKQSLIPLLFLLAMEWFRRRREHPMQMKNETVWQRRLLDAVVILFIFVF